jgi:acetyl esterase/lipase
MSSQSQIPTTGHRTDLDQEIKVFLEKNKDLHLGNTDFLAERAHHTQVFGYHTVKAPIHDVEFTAIRGPHGTIPVRIFFPKSGESYRQKSEAGALVYMHGGGYTVGTVDEFENGLRLLAEESQCQVYAVEYRLAPEWRFPTQLDEYKAVVQWVQGEGGKNRGVDSKKVCGGGKLLVTLICISAYEELGDSAGGNMTAALSLRLKDEGQQNLCGQLLLYPEARLPFDTPAASENNSGLYLECNGIFSFADHYLPRGTPPAHRYVSPGMQSVEDLTGLPPASVLTCGFDPLRDVGVEYAHKLQKADNNVEWNHFPDLTHGYLQISQWSERALEATSITGKELHRLAYG